MAHLHESNQNQNADLNSNYRILNNYQILEKQKVGGTHMNFGIQLQNLKVFNSLDFGGN